VPRLKRRFPGNAKKQDHMHISPAKRLLAFARLFIVGLFLFGSPALGQVTANPAEALVANNIHKGLEILNDTKLSAAQRRGEFQTFLLGVTDMKRIAIFTLGQYGRTASPADKDAFGAAFQDYAVAVYQSYFDKYAGQTLQVTGSSERAPGDFIVATNMIDPADHSGHTPLSISFRVRTDTGTPVIVDFSVEGIWLALEERDQFSAFLGQNGGSIAALISHLNELRSKFVEAR
jgi:phospholipid transport system substrate-binding protein